jgi:hypothetical protein
MTATRLRITNRTLAKLERARDAASAIVNPANSHLSPDPKIQEAAATLRLYVDTWVLGFLNQAIDEINGTNVESW